MASVTIYDQYFVRADGALLAENVGLELTLDGDDKDVFTTVKGFAGQMPVPKKVMCKLDGVIPSSGPEFDAWQKCLLSTKIEMQFLSASTGRTLTTEGFIRKLSIQSGVERTTSESYEFHGKGTGWEGGVTI